MEINAGFILQRLQPYLTCFKWVSSFPSLEGIRRWISSLPLMSAFTPRRSRLGPEPPAHLQKTLNDYSLHELKKLIETDSFSDSDGIFGPYVETEFDPSSEYSSSSLSSSSGSVSTTLTSTSSLSTTTSTFSSQFHYRTTVGSGNSPSSTITPSTPSTLHSPFRSSAASPSVSPLSSTRARSKRPQRPVRERRRPWVRNIKKSCARMFRLFGKKRRERNQQARPSILSSYRHHQPPRNTSTNTSSRLVPPLALSGRGHGHGRRGMGDGSRERVVPPSVGSPVRIRGGREREREGREGREGNGGSRGGNFDAVLQFRQINRRTLVSGRRDDVVVGGGGGSVIRSARGMTVVQD